MLHAREKKLGRKVDNLLWFKKINNETKWLQELFFHWGKSAD